MSPLPESAQELTQDFGPEDVAAVEDAARRFIQTEVAPHLADWEETGEFPRSLYQPRPPSWGGWGWVIRSTWAAHRPLGHCATHSRLPWRAAGAAAA